MVAGFDIDKSPKDIRKSIGVTTLESTVDVDLTGWENLRSEAVYSSFTAKLLQIESKNY